MSRLLLKERLDVAGVTAQRQMLGELPAREEAELPVRRRRRTRRSPAETKASFREMLEAGGGAR